MPHSPQRPPPQPAPPPTGKPDRRALLQAYQEVVRATKEKPAPIVDSGPTRRPFWIAMGLTIAGLAALLVFQPGWLFLRPAPEPPQMQEASLRIRMYVEIDRIDRFKGATGRLPTTLTQAGGDSVGLQYTSRGEGYTLNGRNGMIRLSYTSGTSAEAFLGNSYELIRERRK
jgi:hypothetical protein